MTTQQTTHSEDGRISREIRGHLFLIGIDRPAKRNAFSWEMLSDLSAAFGEYEQDPELRCAVLFAHGDHFTAGLDLMSVVPMLVQGEPLFQPGSIDPWGVHGPARSKPLVCAVQGYCLTLGIELALAADVVVAAQDTRFAQIEVKRGIFPFGGATIRFPQVAGWGNAMRYLLTGDEFTAQEALSMGLVQEVVDTGEQLGRALEIAGTIAQQAPLGVQATIASARAALSAGFDEAARGLLPQIMDLLKSEDATEGFKSFVERRPAKFKGK